MSLAAVLAFAIPVAATAVEWDQKQIAALADQLTRDVAKIKDGIAKDWERSDKHSARYVVLDDLMTLQHQVVALQTLLGAGEGREQTAPVYRRVLIRVSQARQDAAAFPEVAAQKHHIDAAHKTLAKLSAYYRPAPVFPPRSADHHAASSEGISCGIGARAPAAGVGEGSPFEPPHVDPSPRPTAAGLAGTLEAVGRPRKAGTDTAERTG
jgi:hypothetical protein